VFKTVHFRCYFSVPERVDSTKFSSMGRL